MTDPVRFRLGIRVDKPDRQYRPVFKPLGFRDRSLSALWRLIPVALFFACWSGWVLVLLAFARSV